MKQNSLLQRSNQLTSLVLLLAAACGLTPAAFGATDAEPCSTTPESRQLDYWLGNWAIGGPGASANATSRVYLALDKCMVIESWDGGRGHKGQNMFAYSADDKRWHGMFVDNEGRVHVFVDGNVASGTAEFSGPSKGSNGKEVLNRVRIIRLGPDKVEQVWDKSTDNGVTWSTAFSGQYSRKTQQSGN